MSQSLQNQLKKILQDPEKVRKLKTASGESLGKILEREAERLRNIIHQELYIAILSYHPKGWYSRTGNTLKSLEEIQIDYSTNTITIQFNHNLADHESYFTKYYPNYDNKGFTPLLLNEGFKPLFSNKKYPATNYIEKAIERFNENKHPGITVRLQKSDNTGLFYDEFV